MKMTSVSGHLLGHDFEEKYRKWWSCPPAQLFDLPVTKSCQNESANNIKRTLEREVDDTSETQIICLQDGTKTAEC